MSKSRGVVLVAFAIFINLMSGCYSSNRGFYRAESVKGWKQAEDEGGTYIWYHTRQRAIRIGGGGVDEFSNQPSPVVIRLSSYSFRPRPLNPQAVTFLDDEIGVVLHDIGEKKQIPATELMTRFMQPLDVEGSKDFTITIPAFVELSETTPQLTVRLKWVDKKYNVAIPLQ